VAGVVRVRLNHLRDQPVGIAQVLGHVPVAGPTPRSPCRESRVESRK
jgi:hypothetical protein